jgi:hypothetical protein
VLGLKLSGHCVVLGLTLIETLLQRCASIDLLEVLLSLELTVIVLGLQVLLNVTERVDL